MTPTPAAVEVLASQEKFLVDTKAMLIEAHFELENPQPDWGKVFNDVYLALGRVDTLRHVDASLQRMAGRNAGRAEP
jgi:hypothetical protein